MISGTIYCGQSLGQTAVYPRELKERRKPDGKSLFRDNFTGSDEKGGVPLCAGWQEASTKPIKYSQKQKDLGVDRVAPDKLQPFTASTPIKERICL